MREHKVKFNSKQLQKITELIEKEKYKFALEELKMYMQEYPKDNENSLFQYGNIMLKLGNIEEAEETYKNIEKIATKPFAKFWAPYKLGEICESKHDYDLAKKYFEKAYPYHTNFTEDVINFGFVRLAIREGNLNLAEQYTKNTCIKNLNEQFKYYLARLKFLQGNRKEANDIINSINLKELEETKNNDFLIALIIILKKHLEHNTISYHDQQLIAYDERKALNHVINRHVITGDFDNSIDVLKIFEQIDSLIDVNLRKSNTLGDYYFIDYPNNPDKKIKIVCLPNTKKILSMYPCDEMTIEDEYTDENIDEDINEDMVKPKQLVHQSQIDKFNNRYKKQMEI